MSFYTVIVVVVTYDVRHPTTHRVPCQPPAQQDQEGRSLARNVFVEQSCYNYIDAMFFVVRSSSRPPAQQTLDEAVRLECKHVA